jgi:peptidoglycan/xylan/chitin deacetylase (PgdA/CDA1 family)
MRLGAWLASLGLLLGALAPTGPATAPAAAAVTRCSAGLVTLTFDDGPSARVTTRLVRLLDDLRVPATFFMVGERVASAPRTARMVYRHGYPVANHSYRHAMMTRQSNSEIRATLAATDRRLRAAGVVPTRLMRPPYGAMDARVERVIRDAGYVPVLWDVDPRDWENRSAGNIARRILDRLRPGASNVVLQHDAIRNSPNSVDAVPFVVREARRRGYCFARLGTAGRPTPPVPLVRVRAAEVDEGRAILARVLLDRPTSRRTSVLLSTRSGTARSGVDFEPRRVRVSFPVGSTRAVVRIPTLRDGLDEANERVRIRLDDPRRMVIAVREARPAIRDIDLAPGLTLGDASVVEPAQGSVEVSVALRLGRPSGLRVVVDLATLAGTAGPDDFVPAVGTVSIPPGAVRARFLVTVNPDTVDEPPETFRVRVTGVRRARVGDGEAVVTIQPPPSLPPA